MSGRLFWQGQPVGGPIVMQRCINNATGLLNDLLPWGPLCLSEHCAYVCVKERDNRKGERESAQVTCVVSPSVAVFEPGEMKVCRRGKECCCLLTKEKLDVRFF